MRAKVSFIVAVHSVEEYVEQCARSLFEQTLEDIEVVFVIDGTSDDCEKVIRCTLEEYPQKKTQVKILVHEENKGTGEARRDGFFAATGEYVIFIDGDDYVEPRMAELMYGKAIEKDADLVVCDIYWYSRNGVRVVTLAPNGIVGDGENVRDDTLNRRVMPNIWCKLIRRNLFEENRIVWPVAAHIEDMVLSEQSVYYAKRIAHVPEPLYHYRLNPHSISCINSPEKSEKKLQMYVQNNKLIFDFLEEKGIANKYSQGILINKIGAKNHIIHYTSQRKYLKLWLRTYPELNRLLVFGDKNHKSTYREKIWFLVICMGLYPRLEHRLKSRRLRPNAFWLRNTYYR